MNGKFTEKYGQSWGEMNNDTKMMVIVSEIFDLREDFTPLKNTIETYCKLVDKNKWELTLIKYIGGAVSVAIIAALVTLFFEIIGR